MNKATISLVLIFVLAFVFIYLEVHFDLPAIVSIALLLYGCYRLTDGSYGDSLNFMDQEADDSFLYNDDEVENRERKERPT